MKGKDPAFLFYSADFYEGTRTMLPEERACFIDLMIYQHQRGVIPNDLKRVLLYCNGVDEATLKATLEAKFKLTAEGWINERLQKVIDDREAYSEKQSINGIIGQFWKKAKAILSKKDFDNLKVMLSDKRNDEIMELIKNKEINKATLEAMLEALLKHYRNRDRDINKDLIKEGVKGEEVKIINLDKIQISEDLKPILVEWLEYKKSRKEAYKSEKSLQALANELTKLSNNDQATAKAIIQKSMANNWAGIFALKAEPKQDSRAGYKQQDKWND